MCISRSSPAQPGCWNACSGSTHGRIHPAHRMAEGRATHHRPLDRHHRGFPGESEKDFEETLSCSMRCSTTPFSASSTRAAQHRALALDGRFRGGSRPPPDLLQEKQRPFRSGATLNWPAHAGSHGGGIQPGHRAVDRPHLAEPDPELPGPRGPALLKGATLRFASRAPPEFFGGREPRSALMDLGSPRWKLK